MDDYARIHELWTQHDYMGALSTAWSLPATDNYPYFRSAVRLHDLSLSELARRACQQAVSSAVSSLASNQLERSARWVEDLLDTFSPPAALVDHSDGEEAEAFRSHMLRAHLVCVSLALQLQEQGRLAAFERVSHHFQHIAQETDLPLVFFRDLLATLLPDTPGHRQGLRSEPSVSVTALLVGKTQRQGIVATLSLEQRSDGSGLCYPASELAFVRRDPAFRAAEHNACTYVKDAGLWTPDQDVRWRVERRDGQPITTLTGSSMGFSFALGLAKLFVSV